MASNVWKNHVGARCDERTMCLVSITLLAHPGLVTFGHAVGEFIGDKLEHQSFALWHEATPRMARPQCWVLCVTDTGGRREVQWDTSAASEFGQGFEIRL